MKSNRLTPKTVTLRLDTLTPNRPAHGKSSPASLPGADRLRTSVVKLAPMRLAAIGLLLTCGLAIPATVQANASGGTTTAILPWSPVLLKPASIAALPQDPNNQQDASGTTDPQDGPMNQDDPSPSDRAGNPNTNAADPTETSDNGSPEADQAGAGEASPNDAPAAVAGAGCGQGCGATTCCSPCSSCCESTCGRTSRQPRTRLLGRRRARCR